MADRFPLIFNPSVGQVQELAASDNLDLSSSGIIGVTNIVASGIVTATDFNSSSDLNLKKDISSVENAIEIVNQLRGVNFTWKSTETSSIGVIAQEVESVLPSLVSGEDQKAVNYNGLIGVLIEAIKEQQDQILSLKKQIEDLKR
jgi:hypothetical protein